MPCRLPGVVLLQAVILTLTDWNLLLWQGLSGEIVAVQLLSSERSLSQYTIGRGSTRLTERLTSRKRASTAPSGALSPLAEEPPAKLNDWRQRFVEVHSLFCALAPKAFGLSRGWHTPKQSSPAAQPAELVPLTRQTPHQHSLALLQVCLLWCEYNQASSSHALIQELRVGMEVCSAHLWSSLIIMIRYVMRGHACVCRAASCRL